MWSGTAPAASGAERLIVQARAQQLASDPEWHHLLHYEPRLLGPARSTVRSAWFFLSPDGNRDPAAELDATLSALFDPAPRAPRDEPAQCIYGARMAWLAQHLDFAAAGLAVQDCPRRESWRAALDPERLWVVFPDAYLNSPASMFGHTLLRLDGPDVQPATPLLAYAVNYAANTTESNGLLFAVKGLSGGYQGEYSLLPYYEKVREYSRLESRDLWEYPLNLGAEATERLLLHLWELRGTHFTYYFFTKNCSYQLLTLLRVAEPSLDLGHRFRAWAIPTDTLRALGPLIGPPHFRPALATSLSHRAAAMSADQQREAVALAEGEMLPALPDAADEPARRRQAETLTLANEIVQYRHVESRVDSAVAAPRSLALLRARAATGVRGTASPPPPPDAHPLEGHATARWALGSQFRPEGDDRLHLGFRPAYHDLLDPAAGYRPGQHIVFGDVALALSPESGHLRLDRFTVLDIVSLSPGTAWARPMSWAIALQHERPDLPLASAARATVLDGGVGRAWGEAASAMGYGLTRFRVAAGSGLGRGHEFQAGAALGVWWAATPQWTLWLEGQALAGVGAAVPDRYELAARQHWQLGRHDGLRLEARYLRSGRHDGAEVSLQWLRYF